MKISIVRSGRLIHVKPFPESLESVLSFAMSQTEYRRGKIFVTPDKVQMFSRAEDDPDLALVPAGFTHRVCSHLDAEGYEVEYTDVRDLGLEPPRIDRLDPLREFQKVALSRIFASVMGIVETATATGKSFLIYQICKAYPSARIIITSHDTPPLQTLYKKLRMEYGDEVRGLGVVGKSSSGGRITLCHISSLLKAPIDEAQILLYDEVHGAAAPERAAKLAAVAFANMYGFSASPTGRLDKREPVIEGLFGPVIYRMSYLEAKDSGLVSNIVVHLYELHGVHRNYDTHWRRQLFGIVRNEARNQFIAKVAQRYGDKTQVIMAQDNLEHVFRLHQLLPTHVPVYAAKSMTPKRWKQLKRLGLIPEGYHSLYPGQEFQLAEQFRQGEIRKVICTSVWNEGIDLPNLEVLIRADGLPGKIQSVQIPGRVARKTDEKTEGIIVDFIDNFGRAFLQRSKTRIANYRASGYQIERRSL